jgi:RNA recognition motif-containing protein
MLSNLDRSHGGGGGGAPKERRDLIQRGGSVGGGERRDNRDGGRDYDRHDNRDRGDRSDRGGRDGGRQRGPLTEEGVNTTGPFVLFCGNLNFKTTAESLGTLFYDNGCDIDDVVIATDDVGKSRGFGHITFSNRDSLVNALQGDGSELDGRNIKIDIDSKSRAGGRDGSRGGGRDGGQMSAADTEDSWARGARKEGRDNSGRERRDGGDRDRDRGDRRSGGGMDDSKPFERGLKLPHRDQSNASGDKKIKERPKLNLIARTVPVDEVASPAAAASSNIFGDAKPRDGSQFEKDKEKDSRQKKDKDRKKRDNNNNNNNNIILLNKNEKSQNKSDTANIVPPAAVDNTPIQRGVKPEGKARDNNNNNNNKNNNNNNNNNNNKNKKQGQGQSNNQKQATEKKTKVSTEY